jgi:hypothetical protein
LFSLPILYLPSTWHWLGEVIINGQSPAVLAGWREWLLRKHERPQKETCVGPGLGHEEVISVDGAQTLWQLSDRDKVYFCTFSEELFYKQMNSIICFFVQGIDENTVKES